MVRYKLYSIEADEVVNIIALARIKPGRLQFNPGFYQYGGAYLYPLGAWYFALSKLGLIHVAPFEQMLKDPQAMDRVWIAGRAFILAAFALSALLLFLALAEIAPAGVALAALAIYLLCPASIMLSQVDQAALVRALVGQWRAARSWCVPSCAIAYRWPANCCSPSASDWPSARSLTFAVFADADVGRA